jgi:hypothetical protein
LRRRHARRPGGEPTTSEGTVSAASIPAHGR